MNDSDQPSERTAQVDMALANLWTLLGSTEDLAVALQRLTELAVRIFPGGEVEASVTVVADDEGTRPQTIATSNPEMLSIDKAQYDADHGPCLEAARDRVPIHTDLDEARERWPDFAAAAADARVVAYVSAPLVTDRGVIGSFNLYGRRPDGFAEADAPLLTLFTNSALAAIAIADQRRQASKLAEGLRTAMESRSTIDQAIGMLRERHGLNAAQAWTTLTKRSQDHNIKVRDLAAHITAHSGRRYPADDSGH